MLLVVGRFRTAAHQAARNPQELRALVIDGALLFQAILARMLAQLPMRTQVVTSGTADGLERMVQEKFDLVVCPMSILPARGDRLAVPPLPPGNRARIVLFVEREEAHLLPSALRSGAAGFFSMGDSYDDFIQGVELVLGGHMALGPQVAEHVLDLLAPGERAPAAVGQDMSKTEREILGELLSGLSVKEIAEHHSVSPKTIRNRLSRIYQKLGIEGRRGRGQHRRMRPGPVAAGERRNARADDDGAQESSPPPVA